VFVVAYIALIAPILGIGLSITATKNLFAEGKKALVWTANEAGSQKHFLCTRVDGLITDNVSQAMKIASEMEKRSDFDRMVDKVKTMF